MAHRASSPHPAAKLTAVTSYPVLTVNSADAVSAILASVDTNKVLFRIGPKILISCLSYKQEFCSQIVDVRTYFCFRHSA